MRNKIVARAMAAVLAGAMVMTTPSIALADTLTSGVKYYDVNTKAPTVANLAVTNEDGKFYLTWTPFTLAGSQSMYVEYSTDAGFADDKTSYSYIYKTAVEKGKFLTDNLSLKAGIKYYLRAVVEDWSESSSTMSYYGAYSNVVEYTPEIEDPEIDDVKVAKTSVTFRFDDSDTVTGYVIYRKTGTGTKYTKVATVADNVYADKSLKANQTYSYKICAYVYDEDAKTTSYSDPIYRTYTTWGSALKLKARATGKRTVKLTWTKVTGATGYKIYRAVGGTYTSEVKAGYTASYSNYKLIKTIKKAKTVSYTDKKLNAGQTYTYKVVAYKNVKKNGKTSTVMNVEDSVSVTLDFDGFKGVKVIETENADGSKTLKWNKILGAEKYVVKQYIKQADGSWGYVAITGDLPGTTTSYVFPAGESNDTSYPDYQIWVYSGTEANYRRVETSLTKGAKTTGITAVANADLTGVTVSWQPVAGALYYKVYRSTTMSDYNPDTDSYGRSGTAVQILEKDGTPVTDALGTYYEDSVPIYTDKIPAGTTSIEDKYQGYAVKKIGAYNPKTGMRDPDTIVMYDKQQAPAQGVRYYYYVQAFTANGKVLSDGTPGYDEATQYDKPASVVLNSVSLAKPTIKSIKAGKKKATVSWKKVTGATKYYVYYSTKKSSGYVFAGITTKTKLAVTGLTSGKKYYFKVKAATANAVGADVFSALSTAKSKKVK